ncbi:HD domain-containing protein [Desulfurobacterium sp. TC5-1]|uniref:HD domain-containing protein n=1 Tax=Desulfurobacterium sp. TC5-1 TaxID=1158318 RepID=UPI0003B771BF|nr:HD domain-containing protein [Desulfurobacterium sp. TC5-1]
MFRRKRKNRFYDANEEYYLGVAKDVENNYGFLYYDKPTYHMVGFGASGSGKTEFIKVLTYQSIEAGYQVLAIDPKGSASWLEAFLLACDRKGILYDKKKGPIFFAPTYTNVSFRFNPLYNLEPAQIAEVVVSGIKEGKEPFFKEIAYEITYAIALGLFARGEKEITFSHIYEYINQTSIENLHRLIERDLVSSSKINFRYVDDAMRVLDKLKAYDPQYFPRVNGSLRTYLTKVVTGDVGRLINVRGNLLWDRIQKGSLLMFAFLNKQVLGEMAVALSRILLSNIQQIVGYYANRRRKIEPQLRIVIDEMKQVAYRGFETAFGLFREFNVSLTGFTQSYSDLVAEIGKERTEAIMESSGAKIIMYLGSVESQKYFSQLSGKVKKPRVMVREGSIFVTYLEDYLVPPEFFEKLKPGHYIAFIQGKWYRGYMPLLKDEKHVEIVAIESEEELDRVREALSQKYDDFVIANLFKLAENYVTKDNVKILVVNMEKLKENYSSKEVIEEEIKSKERKGKEKPAEKKEKVIPLNLKDFLEKYEGRITEDLVPLFRKIVEIFSTMQQSPSVVLGDNPLKEISLVEHLLATAEKAYEYGQKELTVEDLSLLFMAALTHDIGKELLEKKNYDTEKHPEEGAGYIKELAESFGIKKDKVNVITSLIALHHEDAGDPYDPYLKKLLKILKKADQDTRKEEEKRIIVEASGVKLDKAKLKRDLEKAATTKYGKSRSLFCYGGYIYVSYEKGQKYMIGKPKHPDVLARMLDGEVVKIKGLRIDDKDIFKGTSPKLYVRFDGAVVSVAPWNSGKVEIFS